MDFSRSTKARKNARNRANRARRRARDTLNDAQREQIAYMDYLANNTRTIVPEQWQSEFCLIFGQKVIAHHPTREGILKLQNGQFACLSTAMYCPH